MAGPEYYAGAYGGDGSVGRVRVAMATGKKICVTDETDSWDCETFSTKDAYCEKV
jgi:hypothetical protein